MSGEAIISRSTKRIVIADDHEAIRKGVRQLIERPDRIIVGEAGNGEEAVELITREKPDLAILDYSLPLLSGLQVIKKITEASPQTELLLYTMHDKEDVQLEALRSGARGYVLKTDPADVLVAAVQSLLLRKPYFSQSVSQVLLENFTRKPARTRAVITDREMDVLKLIAEGYTNKMTAKQLEISVKTVETHRASIQAKLGARCTADIVRYAIRNGIVEA